MKFKKATDWQSSWLQGEIDVTYAQLVSVFGPEHSKGDGYKVQAEWDLEFEDGTYSTIYDWKMGDGYQGKGDGIPKEQVTCWHIGGSLCPEAVNRVVETLAEAGIKVEVS
jgi:hypothetical protein